MLKENLEEICRVAIYPSSAFLEEGVGEMEQWL